jgi:hypothetical protein
MLDVILIGVVTFFLFLFFGVLVDHAINKTVCLTGGLLPLGDQLFAPSQHTLGLDLSRFKDFQDCSNGGVLHQALSTSHGPRPKYC